MHELPGITITCHALTHKGPLPLIVKRSEQVLSDC